MVLAALLPCFWIYAEVGKDIVDKAAANNLYQAYGRALAVCAAKAFEADDVIQFSEAAKIAIVVERSLHNGFMQDFGISKAQFEDTPLTLACHHYTSYLQATAWAESYPVVLAALLPCFWIYAEVGKD
ncbi:hypothetical protein BUE68_12250, partial [Corynebacterium diphtheriae]